MKRRAAAGLAALLLLSCAAPGEERGPGSTQADAPPSIDTSTMEPRVAAAVDAALADARARPGAAAAWGRLGAVCDAHDLHACAEAGYRKARELAPGDFRWPYLLSIVREMLGADAAELSSLLEEAARDKPDFPPTYFRLGEALMRHGRLDEAAAAYRHALELDPRLAVAHRGLGQLLLAQGHPRDALDHLQQAERLGGEDQRVLAAMAQAYTRLGDRARAESAARRSASTTSSLAVPDPVRLFVASLGTSARQCFERAKGLMQQGRYAQALEQLHIVEEVKPEDPEVHHYMGGVLLRLGRVEDAQGQFERALALNPDMAGAHGELGKLLLERGDAQAALPHLERLVELQPDYKPGYELLARALEALGRAAEAAEARRRGE